MLFGQGKFSHSCCHFCYFFGLCLRVRQYAANRSLGLDEAMLALNIVNRSVIELTHPLAHHQPTPDAEMQRD